MTLLALALAVPAHAGEVGLGGYVGHLATPDDTVLPSTFNAGLRLRGRWSDRLGAEAALGFLDGALDPRLELQSFLGDTSGHVVPFLAVGGGALLQDGDANYLVDAGLGIDTALFPVLDLRTDARFRLIGDRPLGGFLFTVGLQLHTPRGADQDRDQVTDSADACVDVPEDQDGFADEDGCPDPDNDSDGVLDAEDRCAEAEDKDAFEDGDGCPDLDNDKDGIPDATDACIDAAEDKDGWKDTDGCADEDDDGDGVPDAKDGAPREPETVNGFRDLDGVPDEVPAGLAKFSGRIEGVRFQTGKAALASTSIPILQEAAKVLAEFPEVRLEVQGHTDDQGDDAKNLALSQARAEAVVTWLVGAGVARERLEAKGFGETKPEVPNDSEAHRAQNRRVEFRRLP